MALLAKLTFDPLPPSSEHLIYIFSLSLSLSLSLWYRCLISKEVKEKLIRFLRSLGIEE